MRQAFPDRQDDRHRQFLALADDLRSDLHRYCARMTGSVTDGEDVVQDTLTRAYSELAELKEPSALRPWLFRIAHNRALDYLRRYERRMSEPLDAASDLPADKALEPDNAVARNEAIQTALSQFLELAPVQRSCVILKDVFDYSLDEIAAMLDMSVSAIKSALVRGRARLRDLSAAADAKPERRSRPRAVSPAVTRYAKLFNQRDWDGVRAMLVNEVKLELVSRLKWVGRGQVSSYFTNYDSIRDWYLVPGWLDGREVLAVLPDPDAAQPSYFVELTIAADRVAAIRDFRHVPYIMRDAVIELVHPGTEESHAKGERRA
jgi:RNA polymerase sigma-70 factor (ECF subfamily)